MTSNSSSPDVPPFYGIVETTVNALRLIHAARSMIKSGAVFVFSVEESGIKRWTDGLLWSPSRIVGNFLVYREINERNGGRGNQKKAYPADDSPSRAIATLGSSPEQMSMAYKGLAQNGTSANDQGTFKVNGLIKKTITVTIDGSDLHLISYYTAEDLRSGKLKRPSCRPDIMALNMPPHIFRLTNFRNPPKVEIGPDGKSRLVCETEDLDSVDCKVEEPTYHISESPDWTSNSNCQSSAGDGHFSGSSLYSLPNHSPTVYARESASDRWPSAAENLRMPSSARQEIQWSASPTHHNHIGLARRGGNFGAVDSWSSSNSQSGRWQGSQSYESSTGLDRSRARLGQSPLTTIVHRKGENEMLSAFNPRHVGEHREIGSQRPSWLPTEVSENRNLRSLTSSSSSPPFPAHSYGAAWSTNDTGALNLPSSQSPYKSTFQTYDGSYVSGTGKMLNSGDYSNIDEYTDS